MRNRKVKLTTTKAVDCGLVNYQNEKILKNKGFLGLLESPTVACRLGLKKESSHLSRQIELFPVLVLYMSKTNCNLRFFIVLEWERYTELENENPLKLQFWMPVNKELYTS